MKRAKEILEPKDYANKRNIRSIGVVYVVLGVLILPLGVVAAFIPLGVGAKTAAFIIKYTFSAVVVLWALAGIVGSTAVLRGNRKWSSFVWVIGAFYMAFFPLGTLLSIIFFRGLKRYYDSID